MKNKTQNGNGAMPPFENGQVWQLSDETHVRIELVGRTLVHYKRFAVAAKRPAVQLSGIGTLETFLRKNRAVLLQKPPVLTPPTRQKRATAPARPKAKSSAKATALA